MQKTMKICLTILSLFVVCAYSQSQTAFTSDCRRQGTDCENGGSCNQDGTCACTTDYTGRLCQRPTAALPCDTADLCKNGGTCFKDVTVEKCECADGFLGPTCETKRAVVSCPGTSMSIDLNFPDTFKGSVKLQTATAIPEACNFVPNTADNIITQALDIQLEANSDATNCGKEFVEEKQQPDGKTFNAMVLIQYQTALVSSVDEVINVTCGHPESGVPFYVDIASVGVNPGDLTVIDRDDTFKPIVLVLLNKNMQPMTTEDVVVVGDIFYIYVYLVDTAVYKGVKIDAVIANDTNQPPLIFDIFKDDCPTEQGMMAANLQEDFQMDVGGLPRTGVYIKMSAFKFIDSSDLGIEVHISICRDIGNCQKPTPEACQEVIKIAEAADAGTDTNTDTSGTGTDTGTGGDTTGTGGDTAGAGTGTDQGTGGTGDDTAGTGGTGGETAGAAGDTGGGTADGAGALRRRRDADSERTTLTTVLRVRGPNEYTSDANTGEQVGTSVETCLAKTEILSAMIILGVLTCILLIACCVLALCLLMRKTKKDTQASSHYYGNERFQIPRAHVNDAYRDL